MSRNELQRVVDRSRDGFTLVELMVVVVIIGLLASAVTFKVRGYLVTSKQNVARMDLSKISAALETFNTLNDRYPSNEEGLAILAKPSKNFVEGILSKVPVDPWGQPYQYNQPGRLRAFDIISFGADKREGGSGADEDITSDDVQPSSGT
ncbi:Type II secretion system protein G precursor [Caulifigura coniformis]|uniref:Type II secretion system core protein G n=1 Tax=Caulifigura coniformis TaxID=2527983 RepID=A0A517SMD2_9PLAN|nr:type II secretion system major pseudopilin GspG [Caulifigura coniformis]QDT57282.1 Type II secretion system protein G precursor [Caulifigura coniformis]